MFTRDVASPVPLNISALKLSASLNVEQLSQRIKAHFSFFTETNCQQWKALYREVKPPGRVGRSEDKQMVTTEIGGSSWKIESCPDYFTCLFCSFFFSPKVKVGRHRGAEVDV